MSKQKLESLLDRIIKEAEEDESFRAVLNTKEHIYTVILESLKKEIKEQLSGISDSQKIQFDLADVDSELDKAVQKYYDALHKRFTDYKPREYLKNIDPIAGGFELSLRNKETKGLGSVFDRIDDLRKNPLTDLKSEVKNIVLSSMSYKTNKDSSKYKELQTRIYGTAYERTYYPTDPNSTKGPKTVTQYSGGLLEKGHLEGYSVIEKELEPLLREAQDILSGVKNNVVAKQIKVAELKAFVSQKLSGKDIKQTTIKVKIFDQGARKNNAQSQVERRLREDFYNAILTATDNVDWANEESSPSPVQKVRGRLHLAAKLAGASKYDRKAIAAALNNAPSQAAKTIVGTSSSSRSKESLKGKKLKTKGSTTSAPTNTTNWSSLTAIINQKLSQQVANNMGAPGLVYRTGRLANSAKVVNVETTKDGYPSIVFDYQRAPYDVFDRVKGSAPWNTPARDPRALVDKSVREIVQEMAIGRFYTRRA
jgi:hypothetical protein